MKVKIAKKITSNKVIDLRLEAYKNASKAKIEDFSFLHWSDLDEQSIVFYVENELGKVISSFRGIYVNSREEIERIFGITVNTPLEFPVLLLDKMVTDINYRGMGISGVLRFLFINSVQSSSIKNIAITINEGTSRIALLKELGYSIEKADLSNRKNSVYQNETAVLFGVLNESKFKSASLIAKEKLKVNLANFHISVEDIQRLTDFMRQDFLVENLSNEEEVISIN